MDDRITFALILLLFVLYCLVLVIQEYGYSGNEKTKEELRKILPAALTPCAILLLGGLIYLRVRTKPSDYDIPALTVICFAIFTLSILTLHASLYKVNLS
jgi:hypothetical protein